jgi:hypothetical protein
VLTCRVQPRHATRLSAQTGPMRAKLAGPDENANRFASANAGKAVLGGQAPAAAPQRRMALNDLSNNAKKVTTGKAPVGKVAAAGNQRVPLQQKGPRPAVPASNSMPAIAQRPAPTRTSSFNENARPSIAPLPKRGSLRRTVTEVPVAAQAPVQADYEMEVEEAITVDTEIEEAPTERVLSPIADEAYEDEDTMDADEYDPEDWLYLSPDRQARSEAQVNAIRETFQDEVDEWDTTMVSEYADEIFAYMESMEVCHVILC